MSTSRSAIDTDGDAQMPPRSCVLAPLYLVCTPPVGAVCCRCDELLDASIAVNVPGLTKRGWSHRSCLPDWLLRVE